MEYENPVLPGFHPDPTVCCVGEDVYLATSSFEYTPGVPLYHSRNLVDWEPIGHALTDDQLDLSDADASGGIFAPTLRHHDGTYYLVTTNVSGDGHFVITADDPRGEWSDPVWIDASGIDPDLCWDTRDANGDDATAYFTYRSGPDGIEQAEIDLDTGELGETRQLCRRLVADYTEAPHLYEIDGTYYLIVAEGGTHTKHMVCVARADEPTGPYEPCPDNPILSHRTISGMYNPIQATGHGDLVQAPDGSWWLVFLGIRKHGGHPGWHHLGRETFLAPVTWVDGWPVVNDDEPIEREMVVPETALEREDAAALAASDTETDANAGPWMTRTAFDDAELGPEWNYRFAESSDRVVLDDGTLTLASGAESLDSPEATFVGRRQQHFDCAVRTRLAFDPAESAEAGLAAVYDEGHHYELGVTGLADRANGEEADADADVDGRRAVLRATIGGVSEIVGETTLSDDADPVTLAIDGETDTYRFAVETDGETETVGTLATRYLSTEVAGGFTGVYVGLYATGDETAFEPARFESFTYRPSE